jgi:hypothetical protein
MEHDEAEEDPCHSSMSVEALLLLDIANRDAVELFRVSSTGRIDRHQNRPRDTCANNADEH